MGTHLLRHARLIHSQATNSLGGMPHDTSLEETFTFHSFDPDTFLPKEKPVRRRDLRTILYSLPISHHPGKNLKRYVITQVSPTNDGVMFSYVNDTERAEVAEELNQNCPGYLFFYLYNLSVWPLDIYNMLSQCFSQADVDLSLRYSYHDGNMVVFTPPTAAQPDPVDSFFEVEFEDEDDHLPQPPRPLLTVTLIPWAQTLEKKQQLRSPATNTSAT